MGLRLGAFITGSVIAVFVVALMVLNSREEDLLIASTEYNDSPLKIGWAAFGLMALAVDHRSKAQRGIYNASEGETGDDEGNHALESDLNQPHTSGQNLTWKQILDKITDLESRLNEVSKEATQHDTKKTC